MSELKTFKNNNPVFHEGGEKNASEEDSSDEDQTKLADEEDKFAKHVEDAKRELKKQVMGMFFFSMLFTIALCGLFYGLIESNDYAAKEKAEVHNEAGSTL